RGAAGQNGPPGVTAPTAPRSRSALRAPDFGPRAALPAALLGQLLQHLLALPPLLGQLLLVGHGPQRGDHVGDPLAEGLRGLGPGPGPLLLPPLPRHGVGLGFGRPHAEGAALPGGAVEDPHGLVPLLLALERHEGERLLAEELYLVRAQPVLGEELLHVVKPDILREEAHEEHDTSTENADDSNHDPQFEPIVSLPEQEIKTLEEDEEELFKMRAKLFRFASENDLPEWKERGTGDVKLLKHKEKGTIRLLMRRDKTLKICANHYITPLMELRPNAGSDRAWVWNTHADFADECPKPELLAIRFLNAENAQKFKAKFEECRNEVDKRAKKAGTDKNDSADKVAEKLEELSVKEESKEAEKKETKENEEKQ
uniref:Ran-specific GTPase-activating protein n=2 Tax=Gallus gallus TaxID=9031 RepID=A0A8V0Z8Z7_CHICK